MKQHQTGNPFNGRNQRSFLSSKLIVPSVFAFTMLACMSACNTGNKQASEDQTQEESVQEEPAMPTATAVMEAASGSNVTGEAIFTDEGNGTIRFELTVENLSPGEHAVHLHEKGDCSAEDGSSAGGHWNPTMKPHGKRGEGPCHKGDVGNMAVGNDGKGIMDVRVDGWTIDGPDSTNVLGKAVIVHEKADDFTTQPTGNAGGRLSCGVIKKS